MELILGRAAVGIRAAAPVRRRIEARAGGRPLVIDFQVDRVRGWSFGDVTVGFRLTEPGPEYLEIEPIGDVPVLMDRRLLPILRRGSRLLLHASWFGERLWLDFDRPGDWLDFLDGCLDKAS